MKKMYLPAKKWIAVLACALSCLSQAQVPVTAPLGNTAIIQGLSLHPVTVAGQVATALPDGRWLLTGGQAVGASASANAYIVDASGKNVVTLSAHLQQARSNHTATVLPNGKIFIFGGLDAKGNIVTSAEQFDPATGVFSSLPGTGLIARNGHAATLLSDGRVLISGGADRNNHPVFDIELYNPNCQNCAPAHFASKLDTARLAASAALMPNGTVLLWSSTSGGDIIDPAAQSVTAINTAAVAQLLPALSTGTASINASQPVSDAQNVSIDQPLMVRFSQRMTMAGLNTSSVTLLGPNGPVAAQVTPAEDGVLLFVTPQQSLLPSTRYTLFINGAKSQSGQSLPLTAIGFTTQSLNANTGTTLITAPTQTAINTPANNTATPSVAAATTGPATTPTATIATAADDESWHPQASDYHGLWTSGRAQLAKQHLPHRMELLRAYLYAELQRDGRIKTQQHEALLPQVREPAAPAGVTALAGQTLKLNGQPLAGVTVSMGNQSTVTDANGEFLLTNIPEGEPPAASPVLQIDGRSASNGNQQYGRYFYQMHIKAGRVNGMRQPIWMARLDTAHTVTIASPTTQDTVITNPQLPGLEVHLPAGTVIRDADGKIVTQVSLTPVPSDQLPFPMPYGQIPVYYTLQPGGAVIQSVTGKPVGAKIVYPNYTTQRPGAKFELFDYDPKGRGWYVYGNATVSPDGKRLISDKDFVLYQFSASSVASSGGNSSNRSPTCKNQETPIKDTAGEPVSCHDGYFFEGYTDLALPGTLPIALQRSYVSGDANQHAFGVGGSDDYDAYLYFADGSAEYSGYTVGEIDLIQGNGSSTPFYVVGSNNNYLDPNAVWQSTMPGPFYMATLHINGSGGWGTPFVINTKDGTQFTFSYYQSQLMSIEDRYGNRIGIARDGQGRKTQVSGSNGRSISFQYNTPNCAICVSQANDSAGRQVSYAYSNYGELTQVTDANGGITTYTYDPVSGNIATVRDPHNNAAKLSQPTTTNVYYGLSDGLNLNGRVKQQTDGNGAVTTFAYSLDANGNNLQTTVTDPLQNVRVLQYTAAGMIAQQTLVPGQPEQQTVTNVWSTGTNLLQTTTDALGRTTKYQYDSLGNVTQVTALYGTASAVSVGMTYTQDGYNQLASITDPLQHVVNLYYDSKGNLQQVKDANGNTASFTSTSSGQLASATVGGNTVNLTYDGADLVQITDAQQHIFSLTPDVAGRTIQTTDALGHANQTSYDALNRVTQTTDALKRSTAVQYDENGAITKVTDAKSHSYGFGYDALDNLTSSTDLLNQSQSYQYDLNGNLTQITDRKGQITRIGYDHLNRPVSITYGDTSSVSYKYDSGNRVTLITDSQNGSTTLQYDGFDHLTSITSTGTGTNPVSNTVTYTYYPNGQRQTMTVNKQPTITYSYDAGNRLTQIVQAAGTINNNTAQTVSYNYDTSNRLSQKVLPDGIAMNYGYDSNSNLTSITYSQGSGAQSPSIGALTYGYDANGQRTSVTGSFARTNPMANTSSTVDNANRLTGFNGAKLQYDNNGSLINDGTNSYTWNARNQLVQITNIASGNVVASYSYDAMGRRQTATINGTSASYVYDGLNVVGELNTGSTFLTGLGIDETLAMESPNGTTTPTAQIASYLTDALGSTIRLADANGNKLVDYTYDLYGNTTADAAIYNPFQYTGRENDGVDCLYYYRARYYSPCQQRFISQDPLGLGGGMNPYAYVNGNPVQYTDPTGLCVGPLIVVCVALVEWGPVIGIATEAAVYTATNTPSPETSAANFTGRAVQEATHDVYLGIQDGKAVYAGISKDVAQRACQHGDRFDTLQKITNSQVTKDQARAIEQALINQNPQFQNQINSIAKDRSWYQEAVDWGTSWLNSHK